MEPENTASQHSWQIGSIWLKEGHFLELQRVAYAPEDPYQEREVGQLSGHAWEVLVFVPSTAKH